MQVEIFAAGEKGKGKRKKRKKYNQTHRTKQKQQTRKWFNNPVKTPKKKKENQKIKNLLFENQKIPEQKKNIPALRDIVDLTLNSHKQRLFGIGTIIVLQILLRNLSKLNWWWERLHLFLGFPRPHMMTIVRGHKHAWDQIVHRNTQSDNCKETCRRKTCICCDRFFEGLPQLKGHCICDQIFSFFSSHREKMKKICQQERAKETKLMGRERKKSFCSKSASSVPLF